MSSGPPIQPPPGGNPTLAANGARPFLLDDPDTAWAVKGGGVDVFAVRLRDGVPAGPRHHLFRAGAGRVLFGLERRPGFGLLAVGVQGTELRQFSRQHLEEAAGQSEKRPSLAALLDGWVGALSAAVSNQLPPGDCHALATGSDCALPAQAHAASPRVVVWVRHQIGSSAFLGAADLPPGNGQGFFPLAATTWLTATADARLHCEGTLTFLERPDWWQALAGFHHLAASCLEQKVLQEEAATQERLEQRRAADLSALAASLDDLAGLLEGRTDVPRPAADAGRYLLAACRVVGQALDTPIVAPLSGDGPGDTVPRIAAASRLQVRTVRLSGRWWTEDLGPLVGTLVENGEPRPVALVPTSARAYELHDVAQDRHRRVTAALASEIAPTAFTFYRSLPAAPPAWRDLLRFGLSGLWGECLMVLLIALLGSLLALSVPVSTGMIVNRLIPRAERDQLLQVTLILAAAAATNAALQVTRSISLVRILGKAGTTWQAAVIDRLINLPPPFFRKYDAGDLAQRALGVETIQRTVSSTVLSVVLSGLSSLVNLGLMLYYSWQLTLYALIPVGLTSAAVGLAAWLQTRTQRNIVGVQGTVSGLVFQLLGGIAKLRTANAERRAFTRWAERFARQMRYSYQFERIDNALQIFLATMPLATAILFYFAFAEYAAKSGMNVGDFLAFYSALTVMLAGLGSLHFGLLALVNVSPLYRRLRPILDARPEVDATQEDPGRLTGAIELANVRFRYGDDGPPVLQGVNIRFRPGEFVAVVGPSGAGKSTLLRMLLGFEKPTAGAVYYDGKNLQRLDVRAVRRQIGVVVQNGSVLPGTLLENIVGASNLTEADAWEAAHVAGLDGDIRAMPMGMQTVISEGGTTLAGGQRQRLLIARAVVRRPRILFFDEATSALDNRTQALVADSLKQLRATRVVIAHRLSTVIGADRIFVMQDGQVVQSGTYQKLLDQPGLFAELVKRQLA